VISISEDGETYDVRFFDPPKFSRDKIPIHRLRPIEYKTRNEQLLRSSLILLNKHLDNLRLKGVTYERTITDLNQSSCDSSESESLRPSKRSIDGQDMNYCPNKKTRDTDKQNTSFDSNEDSFVEPMDDLSDIFPKEFLDNSLSEELMSQIEIESTVGSDSETNEESDYETDSTIDKGFNETFESIESCLDLINNENWSVESNDCLKKVRQQFRTLRSGFESLSEEVWNAKRKSWCSVCLEEAQLYCCLWVVYCSNECRLKDWDTHRNYCRNHRNRVNKTSH